MDMKFSYDSGDLNGDPNLDLQNDERRGDDEWNSYILMAGLMSLFMLISICVILYYVYFRVDSNAERRPQRRPGILRAHRISWRGGNHEQFVPPLTEGLCREAVDALPVFLYKPENFSDGLRCAVCLCEFEENDKARLLPSCNHSFHVDCVDMWFYSHSTCPLCRASVEKQADQSVESGNRTMEVSVMEEEVSADPKAVESGSSGEQQRECINGESDNVTIDIPPREK